jgi:hypothetical protein
MPVDILLLHDNPGIDISRICRDCEVSLVIADGSNAPWFIPRMVAACAENGIPFHSSMNEGCFTF